MRISHLMITLVKRSYGLPLDKKEIKKIIALIFEKDNDLLIDLKLAPEHGEEVREYDGVFPGYHMNKTHWNTVRVNNTSLPLEDLIKMIQESDKLTQ